MAEKTVYGLPRKKEEVISLLQEAYASNNLDEAEYEKRLSMAYESKSIEELREVIYDFPQRDRFFPFQEQYEPKQTTSYRGVKRKEVNLFSAPNTHFSLLGNQYVDGQSMDAGPLNVITVLGENNVNLKNVAAENKLKDVYISCILGNTVIDLRNYNFQGRLIELELKSLIGNVTLLLPEGVRIKNKMLHLIGNINRSVIKKGMKWFKRHHGMKLPVSDEEATDNHFYCDFELKLRGFSLIGNVDILYFVTGENADQNGHDFFENDPFNLRDFRRK
ncbi:LiaF domain-containing protein [Limibacter armeniacum]|uniref:DUF1707 SHOCT-like domain-containing protein n=1 Tax=Limibacter armeniacum TaxID=466084 RepID=UPI002FE58215